jgi:hypothetical protein
LAMKFISAYTLIFLCLNSQQPQTYRFIGEFKEGASADGRAWHFSFVSGFTYTQLNATKIVGRFKKGERLEHFHLLTFIDEKDSVHAFHRDAREPADVPYMLLLFEETNPEFVDLWFNVTFDEYEVRDGDVLQERTVKKIIKIELIDTPEEYDHPTEFIGKYYRGERHGSTVEYGFTENDERDLHFFLNENEQNKITYPLLLYFYADPKWLGKTFRVIYKKRYVPKWNKPSGELISIQLVN